jgi:hypothetical protein
MNMMMQMMEAAENPDTSFLEHIHRYISWLGKIVRNNTAPTLLSM